MRFELVGDTFIEIELVLTQLLKENQNLVGTWDPVGRTICLFLLVTITHILIMYQTLTPISLTHSNMHKLQVY